MAAISAIGGVQFSQPAPNVQAPQEKQDPITDQKKVAKAQDGQAARAGFNAGRSATGDVVAAALAAQSEPAELDQEAREDAVKRELISKVFKITEETDLKAMFGDFQISQENRARSEKFLGNLQQIRPEADRPDDALKFNAKI